MGVGSTVNFKLNSLPHAARKIMSILTQTGMAKYHTLSGLYRNFFSYSSGASEVQSQCAGQFASCEGFSAFLLGPHMEVIGRVSVSLSLPLSLSPSLSLSPCLTSCSLPLLITDTNPIQLRCRCHLQTSCNGNYLLKSICPVIVTLGWDLQHINSGGNTAQFIATKSFHCKISCSWHLVYIDKFREHF
jgi:hypothetical protein